MSRCVAIDERGWMRSRLAMAVACPHISKPRFVENSIGSRIAARADQGCGGRAGTRCFNTAAEQTKVSAPPPMLLGIHGVGPEFASVLWSEGLSRQFDNRRQVAAYAGLAPTPWQSGSVNREQGISQSGNRRLRTTMIQLAWLWLRHQPRSALTLWFQDRIERNGGRRRKTTIVALARKLLVALWKYVSAGVVIEGAMIRPAQR